MLLPIIQRHILPDLIVYSDQWAAYNRAGNIVGLEHHTVNHALHFVDPVTGIHTQDQNKVNERCSKRYAPWLSGGVHVARAKKFNTILN